MFDKKFNRLFFLILIFTFTFVTLSFALENSMYLLATDKDSNTGGLARTYLKIVDGSGRVFIDSYPVPKTDTLLSVRFARERACQFTYRNCDKYDFYYVIETNSPFVEGPSAGAALTILTIYTLENMSFSQKFSVTGTINSGNMVGLVGGIPEKIEAAKKSSLNKIFIPQSAMYSNQSNITVYNNPFFSVIPVNTIEEILENLMSKNDFEYLMDSIDSRKTKLNNDLDINKEYQNIMKDVSEEMCSYSENKLTKTLNLVKNNCEKLNFSFFDSFFNNIKLEGLNESEKYNYIKNNLSRTVTINFNEFMFNQVRNDFLNQFNNSINKTENILIDKNFQELFLNVSKTNQTSIIKLKEDILSFSKEFYLQNQTNNSKYVFYFDVFENIIEKNFNTFIDEYDFSIELINTLNDFYFTHVSQNEQEKLRYLLLNKAEKVNYLLSRISLLNKEINEKNELYFCPNEVSDFNFIVERLKQKNLMLDNGFYYSAASFCFTMSIDLTEKVNILNFFNQENSFNLTNQLNNSLEKDYNDFLDRKVEDFFDFQAKMIIYDRFFEIKDRLSDINISEEKEVFDNYLNATNKALNNIDKLNEISKIKSLNNSILNLDFENLINFIENINFSDNKTIESHNLTKDDFKSSLSEFSKSYDKNYMQQYLYLIEISYLEERLKSIESWNLLYDTNQPTLDLDYSILRNACITKISQAEERYYSIQTYYSDYEKSEFIDEAYDLLSKNDYISCIYMASKAKSSYELMSSTMGLSQDDLEKQIDARLEIAKNIIDDSALRGFFPIMGYNYYEYAKSLKETDINSALVYSEYALELSSLDVYFDKGRNLEIGSEDNLCFNDELFFSEKDLYDRIKVLTIIVFLILSIILIFESIKIRSLKKEINSYEDKISHITQNNVNYFSNKNEKKSNGFKSKTNKNTNKNTKNQTKEKIKSNKANNSKKTSSKKHSKNDDKKK